MGFWHTGYGEFHEPVGLPQFKPQPGRFLCTQCGEVHSSQDELFRHRLEAHPLYRPVMLVQGRELGTNRVRITQPLLAADVEIAHCDRAFLNGSDIPIFRLPHELATAPSGICRVVLSKDGVDANFELDFRIASSKDLEGVEEQFKRIARGSRLDTHVIEEFIAATEGFNTAVGYYDGICAYLYGVLAKERAGGSTLPYNAYEGKFNKAAEELAAYNRPLAQTIGSLVTFHFNQFQESARLSPESRVGRVSARYSDWIESPDSLGQYTTGTDNLEGLVTDRETEHILGWASRPLPDLAKKAPAIEKFLNHLSAEYDRTKLHILLGQLYAQLGDVERAMRHAKTPRNVPPFQGWAEALIKMLRGG